jgi:Capsule assembly protein Wzi
VEFLAVLCVLVLLTPGISAASTINTTDQTQENQSPPQQTPPPAAAPAPRSADQLPTPRDTIHFAPYEPLKSIEGVSSTYIPLDSWIYPAVMRLYGLGFVDTVFLGMRPWTRLSVAHMLDLSSDRITGSTSDEAIDIYTALERDLQPDMRVPLDQRYGRVGLDSVYQGFMGIAGTPLRDSFHLGQTDVNDFGRPYASGLNSYTGFSTRGHYGMFSVYFRGEFQHAPSWEGYSLPLSQVLATIDDFATFSSVPLYGNTTIPLGPVSSVNNLTVLEGYVSAHVVGHEISLGKMDNWYGPGVGAGMAWSNNAENVWSLRINRVEPLYIPYISRVAGLFRYDFFVGPLKGHNDPVSPWVHAEKLSVKPTPNFEFGFQRTVIWGGKGHVPITLGTFWRSFYSISDTNGSEKFSRNDPGARFSAVDFSWRLPYLRKWLTFYCDSEVHDDVFPITAPRHAAVRPGLYLSHFPGAPNLDLRVEAASTDPDSGLSHGGQDQYTEVVQRNGYTSNGLLMGDWIGRENKGGQAWLTYHLSPREWLQLSYRSDKASKDFIPGGTTQTDFRFDVVKRLTPDVELKANVQYEQWLIPLYKSGRRSDTSTAIQLTWYPKIDRRF